MDIRENKIFCWLWLILQILPPMIQRVCEWWARLVLFWFFNEKRLIWFVEGLVIVIWHTSPSISVRARCYLFVNFEVKIILNDFIIIERCIAIETFMHKKLSCLIVTQEKFQTCRSPFELLWRRNTVFVIILVHFLL